MLFKAKYNTIAPRHRLFVKGSYVWIDTYSNGDIGMLEEAILEVMAKRQSNTQHPDSDYESDTESNCDPF